MVLKRNDSGFSKTSLYQKQKAIQSIVSEPKIIKKLQSGELIKLQNNLQAKNVPQLETSLLQLVLIEFCNSSKGVVSEPNLQYVPKSEILENLQDQGIT